MVKHELGKWNLDELAKNPNRVIIDKKIARIESDSKRFEKIKKSLNPKISSGKFLKLLHDVENIVEKSSVIGGYASLRYSENTQSDEATALLTHALVNLVLTLKTDCCSLTYGGKDRLMRRTLNG